MIKKLVLNNFLSHVDTTLQFNPGITVFVGHNGSGKSSIIDSITFSLFNEHTRRSNKNLISKGIGVTNLNESGSFVIMDFSAGSIDYRISRHIDSLGHLVSVKLDQLVKKDILKTGMEKNRSIYRPIISGERKQLGESVVRKIETILGMNYPKLQIAGIIQQGEISKIIDSQPKEFKELLNNMIGLDRLDRSFNIMHSIIDEFRILLREKTQGYDDNHIGILDKKYDDNKIKIKQSKESLEKVLSDLSNKTKELYEIEQQIEDLEPKLAKLNEIKTLENTLLRYFKEKSLSLKSDIDKINKIILDVKSCVSILKDKDEVFITLQMVKSEKDELNTNMVKIEGEIGKLNGFTECAKKIQIKDGKCPVCNSKTTTINHMFDISHINKELVQKIKEKKSLISELTKLNIEEADLIKKEKNIISAEKTLSTYDLDLDKSTDKLEDQLSVLKKDFHIISKLDFDTLKSTDLTAYQIDDYSKNLTDTILKMKNDVVNIDINIVQQKKIIKNKIASELVNIQNQKAILEKLISDLQNENIVANKLLLELHTASHFISDLEKIRSSVFNRDGFVSSSLRTWALNLISAKSSDYINTFNVGLSKISLIERPREIKILCYGNRGEIDTVSLSGGEKVAVSLAIRMGIAFLMGSSKIDFIILDEPTTNLDEERRRSFVNIISNAFGKGLGPLSQMIIVTHDEEIFENSEIEQVYKFSMSDKGSKVEIV